MRFLAGFSFLSLAIGGAVACGGSEFKAASDDAGSTVTQNQACTDNAHAHCAKIAACSQELLTISYGDEGTCETRLKLQCLDALSAPQTGGTAEKSEACAKAYATWSCADYLDDNPPAACVFARGGLATGKACALSGQCQTGFCAISPGSACGICAPLPQPGDSCAALTTCGQLLLCVAAAAQCAAFAQAGAACNRGQPCGAGLYCVGSTLSASGACQPAVETVGAACDPLGKTGPGCDRLAGLTCNGMTKQCAAIQYAGPAQPCGVVGSQLALCASAGTCSADAGADAAAGESCTPTAADGAPCDLVYGPFCRDPARCILSGEAGTEGSCQFVDPLACH